MYTLPCHIIKHCPFNNFTAESMKRHKIHSRRRYRCEHNGNSNINLDHYRSQSGTGSDYIPMMQLELEGSVLNPGAKRTERKILFLLDIDIQCIQCSWGWDEAMAQGHKF